MHSKANWHMISLIMYNEPLGSRSFAIRSPLFPPLRYVIDYEHFDACYWLNEGNRFAFFSLLAQLTYLQVSILCLFYCGSNQFGWQELPFVWYCTWQIPPPKYSIHRSVCPFILWMHPLIVLHSPLPPFVDYNFGKFQIESCRSMVAMMDVSFIVAVHVFVYVKRVWFVWPRGFLKTQCSCNMFLGRIIRAKRGKGFG